MPSVAFLKHNHPLDENIEGFNGKTAINIDTNEGGA
jgi:hypothetical protein